LGFGDRDRSRLLRNPIHVTLNEVKGLPTLVESLSRRFFAALRMTRGGFFNNPSVLDSDIDSPEDTKLVASMVDSVSVPSQAEGLDAGAFEH
jgi:hypothetical protein